MLNTLNTYVTLFLLVLVLCCVPESVCDKTDPMRDEVDANEDVAGFSDLDLSKDRSLKAFYYKGGYLSIYEGRNEKLKRYYVTPLTEINSESAKCSEPEIESRYKVRFDVEIWRSEVADEAVKALASPPLNLEVRKEHVHPLSISKIRLLTHGLSPAYEPDTLWKSNGNQRLRHTFAIYAANKEACERMVDKIKRDPAEFASLIQIEIAMSAEKRASREISITGVNIGRSKMFSQLQNMEQTNGEPLLTSQDLNRLAQEIVSSVVASEITTGAYVDKPDQLSFARLLEHQLSSVTIDAKQLNVDKWKSVFWQEEFVRPDHYTKYLNHALKYDEGTKKFSFDNETESAAVRHVASDLKRDSSKTHSWSAEAKASFLGFGGSAGGSSSNGDNQSSHDKNEWDVDDQGRVTMSLDQLEKFLSKRDLKVEWSGDVFVSKSLDLHRINTKTLQYKSTIATQQIQVQTVPITEIFQATISSIGDFDSVGKEHVRILIDQVKSEMNETLEEFAQRINYASERINKRFNETNNNLGRLERELQGQLSDQNTKLQQNSEEINESKLHFQEAQEGFRQTKQELLQKDAELQNSVSGQAAEIGQIRSNVSSLQQHVNILQQPKNCQTYYTACEFFRNENEPNLVHHNVKCSLREQYMTEWAMERCTERDPGFWAFKYRIRIVCCNA